MAQGPNLCQPHVGFLLPLNCNCNILGGICRFIIYFKQNHSLDFIHCDLEQKEQFWDMTLRLSFWLSHIFCCILQNILRLVAC